MIRAAVWWAVSCLAAAGVTPPPAVIDLHCHVAGLGEGHSGCFVSPDLGKNWRLTFYLRALGVTRDEVHEHGDALVVQRLSERLAGSRMVGGAVVLAVDGVMDADGRLDLQRTEFYVPNEFVWAETAKTRNLLYGASINPLRRDALAMLDREAARGAVLIKWLPNIQQFDPADPRFLPFYRRLAALRMPLLVHTGNEHSFTSAHDEWGDPARLESALRCGVTVIAAHSGGSGSNRGERNRDRFVALLRKYPRLYGDISALTLISHAGHLRALLREPGVVDRLVYGSDSPLIATPATSPWYSLLTIGPKAIWKVRAEGNPWDANVMYLKSLGVPDAVFTRGAALLRMARGL